MTSSLAGKKKAKALDEVVRQVISMLKTANDPGVRELDKGFAASDVARSERVQLAEARLAIVMRQVLQSAP